MLPYSLLRMFQYVSVAESTAIDRTWLVDMLSQHPQFREGEYAWEDAAAWLQQHPEKERSLMDALERVVA